MTYSLKPAIAELERFYAFLNEKKGLNLPANAVITIQSAGRIKAHAWFRPRSWENHVEPEIHEINICAESLTAHPYESLAHEMAHFCELKAGKLGSKCGYHGQKFKEYAEKLGLAVEKDEKKGWAVTSETPEFENLVLEFKPEKEVFDIFRKTVETKKAPTKMKKWTCGCTIVRCATELLAECKACGQKFDYAGD